ncbi:MAG: MerR family transcriptional regulator [Nitrospirae bacterium]|nr:MAG: MerR family transcriptional regulator [Nitrospirota bacterium]
MGGQSRQGEKTVYKIGEVAALTKLPAYVLRFWESEFTFLRPKKSPGRHRVYTQVDIETVLEIKRMLYEEGYTIAGLKRYWNRRKRNADPPETIPRHRVERVKAELQAILTKLTSS